MCLEFKYNTDKYYEHSGCHSYIENVYDDIFKPIKYSASRILEIGIFGGGSLRLWRDYFVNSIVVGVDVSIYDQNYFTRVVKMHADAYTQSFMSLFPNNHFDVIIDDGPHTPESQIFFVENYFSKLNDNGIMICEDIASTETLNEMISVIPENAKEHIVFDLREKDSRYDSLVLVVKK